MESVKSVVNCCEEANGPEREYQRLGIKELHLSIIGMQPSILYAWLVRVRNRAFLPIIFI